MRRQLKTPAKIWQQLQGNKRWENWRSLALIVEERHQHGMARSTQRTVRKLIALLLCVIASANFARAAGTRAAPCVSFRAPMTDTWLLACLPRPQLFTAARRSSCQ